VNKILLLAATLVACTPAKPAVTVPSPAAQPLPEPQQPIVDVEPPVQKDPPPPPLPAMQTAKPQELAFPNEPFRAQQPAPGPLREFKLPKPKKFTLDNGITVYLVEQHVLPTVSLQLEIDGGTTADPRGKEGLSSVCMALLTEGTDQLDKVAYSEALADLASSITAGSGEDAVSISMSSLTKYLDPTFELFTQTIRAPGFRAADFDRLQKRRLEALKQQRSSPSAIPNRVSGVMLFGPDHPLGRITTEASLQAITLDDCKRFAAATLQPKTARLYVVGDLTEAQIRKLFAHPAIKSWKGAAPTPPKLPTPASLPGRIFFIDLPGAVQAQVLLLHFGPVRTEADYFQTTILGQVFGGGFASRVNMNLREDKGYSYGARGGFGYYKAYGEFTASAQVRGDTTYQTLLEIDRELKVLASGTAPPTKAEIEREKTGATLALPGRFATAQGALGQYRQLVYFGLPLDYFDRYIANVNKVTEAMVAEAGKKHLRPDQAIYLVVGDGATKVVTHDPSAAKDAPIEQRNPPLMKDGKQVTLREALVDLAAAGVLGPGGFVEVDPDGKPLAK